MLEQPALEGESSRQRKASSPIPPDAKSIGDAWIARLEKRGALIGYGLAGKEADQPVEMVDTGLTEKEFVTWANENGWHVPEHIHWNFVPGLNLPRVSDTAKNAIRVWPASTARTGLQHLALYYGRIELRDGCFFVGQFDQPANKLAWFHAELGLDIDASGYFILRKSG
ncbi:hypothetical protein [Novosphingopyxis sp.]|uniref:hypothetical protein n=1 Tax=Novosphingopyxis sp. TaxID=2709690 RepID=UPI003B593FFA